MTTHDETYNGWTNRETWAANLWLTNEQWTAERLREIATGAGYEFHVERDDALRDFVDELTEYGGDYDHDGSAHMILRDIGSLWRVNWSEIINAAREE